MLEELRVSFFAQNLGTPYPILRQAGAASHSRREDLRAGEVTPLASLCYTERPQNMNTNAQ